MTIPHYVNEHQSDIRAIKPGWYGMESNGKLSSGPFPNQERCLTEVTQSRSNFPASPWRHATHNPEVAAAKKAAMDYSPTRKLLWTLGTRRRGRETEPHNRARGCHESHQDGQQNRNLPLSRIRHRANASLVELVCGHLPHACGPTPHGASYAEYLGTRDGRGSGRGQAKHRPHSFVGALSKGTSGRIARCFLTGFGGLKSPTPPSSSQTILGSPDFYAVRGFFFLPISRRLGR